MTANTKAKLIVFLNALTLIGGAITIILLFRIISGAAAQNAATNRGIEATNKQIISSQKLTEKELGCLASFFSQTNRQNLKINNLEQCEILHTDTGQTEILPLTSISISPAVPSSDTKQNSTTTPTPTQANNTPNQTTSQTTAPSPTAPQVQVPPAKEILGIPMCVPFTGLCVR